MNEEILRKCILRNVYEEESDYIFFIEGRDDLIVKIPKLDELGVSIDPKSIPGLVLFSKRVEVEEYFKAKIEEAKRNGRPVDSGRPVDFLIYHNRKRIISNRGESFEDFRKRVRKDLNVDIKLD